MNEALGIVLPAVVGRSVALRTGDRGYLAEAVVAYCFTIAATAVAAAALDVVVNALCLTLATRGEGERALLTPPPTTGIAARAHARALVLAVLDTDSCTTFQRVLGVRGRPSSCVRRRRRNSQPAAAALSLTLFTHCWQRSLLAYVWPRDGQRQRYVLS